MRVTIVGLGYIGLPTAAQVANHGIRVFGYDIKPEVVATINEGKTHIIEHDLDCLVKTVVANGHLTAHHSPQPADIFVITVPTPFYADKVPDLSYIKEASGAIAPLLQPGNLVILESTSPVGTTELLGQWLLESRPDLSLTEQAKNQIYLAYCPERVLPGQILHELVHNDRVIGGLNVSSLQKAKEFYGIFVKGPLSLTRCRTAEMVKLTENTYRDVNIAFANELAEVCHDFGVNIWELISIANKHPRVNVLNPGIGVGGHCIAVDPWFIIKTTNVNCSLMNQARAINMGKPSHITNKILLEANKSNATAIACLGLSYKPNIDDLRESPAIEILQSLGLKFNGQIYAVEPHVQALPKSLATYSHIQFASMADALAHADLLVVLVAHTQFKNLANFVYDKPILDFVGLFPQGRDQLVMGQRRMMEEVEMV